VFSRVRYVFKRLHLLGIAFIDNVFVLQNEKLKRKARSERDVVALRVEPWIQPYPFTVILPGELLVLIARSIEMVW
jgi:hypothetical protein